MRPLPLSIRAAWAESGSNEVMTKAINNVYIGFMMFSPC